MGNNPFQQKRLNKNVDYEGVLLFQITEGRLTGGDLIDSIRGAL